MRAMLDAPRRLRPFDRLRFQKTKNTADGLASMTVKNDGECEDCSYLHIYSPSSVGECRTKPPFQVLLDLLVSSVLNPRGSV